MAKKVLPWGRPIDPSGLPLLKTKLFTPRGPSNLVARPQLTEKLNRGLEGRLTLVVAPAGFGKSTVLAEWVRRRELPFCWVSLDASDNDPVRFYSYMLAALETVQPGTGKIMPALHSSAPSGLDRVMALLIDNLSAFPGNLILVMDDYHLIQESRIHQSLSYFIEYMPANMHLALSSRIEPPFPLTRLRTRGQLTELDARDLRFGPVEVGALYQQQGIHLTGEQVKQLEARTEGWAAGLQLAALSMQGGTDISRVIAGISGENRYIATYLAEEVFEKWPTAWQEFLMRTSIPDRLCGLLCDAVTGGTGSAGVLYELAATNAFVFRLDQEGRWYRYHHLFTGFLQDRLREKRPSLLSGLHRKAAEWYENNGFATEAVKHCLKGEDFGRAASLIELHAPELLNKRETAILQAWLKYLPDTLVSQNVMLCLIYAWTGVLAEQPELVELWLLRAETAYR